MPCGRNSTPTCRKLLPLCAGQARGRRYSSPWIVKGVVRSALSSRASCASYLERYRLAGHDLEIDTPHYVPLDIALLVCLKAGYTRSAVKQALLEAFGNADLPGGQRGFFHPDNITFGQTIYLSQLVAAAMAVTGVDWVDTQRFQRWGASAHGELTDGFIQLGRLEIARLDNDPSLPENGKIEFIMEGGL